MEWVDLSALKEVSRERWWLPVSDFLTNEALQTLTQDFPSMDLFDHQPHRNLGVTYNGRWVLDSVKHAAKMELIPESWRKFRAYLSDPNGPYYKEVSQKLGIEFDVRFEWHQSEAGFEIGPHTDNPRKWATHILYFHSVNDWDARWGGETLVLLGNKGDEFTPNYEDFREQVSIPFLGNKSFFLITKPDSYHAVKKLCTPPGIFRKTLNIILLNKVQTPEMCMR